ncbi:FAD-dependent oxidoreductase [Sneathia sanguinegens]|uniref:FAD-dependent oxidoreductase n=1 Tax=Sneathia sanguinegens TaxID=40543 RepID=A0ABT7HLG2_9FUSO|nr:FAD-dependent oxidoreductase [Sneathia sanguinegens]MDK9580530.1 FAD-dependent oxidoreductase [Sneathia sanguinegens]
MFELNLNLEENKKNFKEMRSDLVYDVIVIGAGPAAISSAIYAKRKGMKIGIVAENVGGQVLTTNGIENIIGTVSTTGPEFATSLEKHAKEYEIPFYQGHLVSKIIDGNKKLVVTDNGVEFKTKSIIIATGAKHRELNVKGEKEFKGKGVHYCSTCDGPFYRNLDVIVAGGGNSGVEAALDLANIAKSVTIIEYLPELKADVVLQEKANSNSKIKIKVNTAIDEIKGDKFVTEVLCKERTTQEVENLKIDGVFVEIGLRANTDNFKDIVKTNKIGEIEIDEYNRTSCKGIFAAGDCTTVPYKQIIIALGEGAKAALSAFNYIINN